MKKPATIDSLRPSRHVVALEIGQQRDLDLRRRGDLVESETATLTLLPQSLPEIACHRVHRSSPLWARSHCRLTAPTSARAAALRRSQTADARQPIPRAAASTSSAIT